MGLRWIDSDIAKPLVSSNEELAVRLNCLPDAGIFPTTHLLLDNATCFVALIAQALRGLRWQVLVNLDVHGACLRCQRQKNILFDGNRICGVSQRSGDILIGKLRIGHPYLSIGHAISQAADDHDYRNAGTFDAGIAMM